MTNPTLGKADSATPKCWMPNTRRVFGERERERERERVKRDEVERRFAMKRERIESPGDGTVDVRERMIVT